MTGTRSLPKLCARVDHHGMTNCVGINCARILARLGVARTNAVHMLMDELQLTTAEAELAVATAFSSETRE